MTSDTTPQVFTDLAAVDSNAVDGLTPPPSKVVDWVHGQASTAEPNDVHHRIGFGPSDAAAGNHTHNGKDSPAIAPTAYTLTVVTGASTTAQLAAAITEIQTLLKGTG